MPITEGGIFAPTQNIVSPGVFTREIDQSGLAQGVANIGGAIVAPFADGPAFFPKTITDVATLESTFGVADGIYYGPYTAKQYLQEQGIVTVVRIGGLTGYWQKNPLIIFAQPGVWGRNIDQGGFKGSDGSNIPVDYSTQTSLSSVLTYVSSSFTTTLGKTTGYIKITSGSIFSVTFGSEAQTATVLTNNGSVSGSILYSGQTFNFTLPNGAIIGQSTSGSALMYISSSLQGDANSTLLDKLTQAFIESNNPNLASRTGTGFVASYPTSPYQIKVTPPSNFSAVGNIYLQNPKIYTERISGGCDALLKIDGFISGSFGKYNGSFSTVINNSDTCNPIVDGRQKMILAVLANTQNASTQFSNDFEVYGFDTSTLLQVTSSVFPYKGNNQINPNENLYNLTLKYNFTNPDGTNSSGTYGYYDFSLNENDNNYIKDVFGVNPTVGNPAKQIAGQKVEAAYNYVLFEDSIKKFVAEKTSTMGWKLMVGTNTLSQSSITGEPLKFVDQYSTNLNAGDSAFSITNAKTPWIYSQKIAPFKGNANESAKPTKFKLFKVHTLSDGTPSNLIF